MKNLDLLHFEQLKKKIEQRFLEENTPSSDSISKWKGIDIIYFQEDLRKKAKGNISEKSFYTYFKSNKNNKLPRIDMLNILSIYAGYQSWFDFRKKHSAESEIVENENNLVKDNPSKEVFSDNNQSFVNTIEVGKSENENDVENIILQKNTYDNKEVIKKQEAIHTLIEPTTKNVFFIKKWVLVFVFVVLTLSGTILGVYWKSLFGVTYTYSFRDADRNGIVNVPLNIKLIKHNESPIYYRIEPGQDFVYSTNESILKIEITSPLYENMTLIRNLNSAPKNESIILKPDDYKTAVYYYSKKSIPGDAEDALEQMKLKRKELEMRISDNAIIYQVFDNSIYGIETLDKERYITLVTTPTTSLKNLSFLDVKSENGKIISIKFRIKEDE